MSGEDIDDNGEEYSDKPDLEPAPVAAYPAPAFSRAFRRSEPSYVWLTTFTDMVALMLTFFVMTYAMSEPKKEMMEKLTSVKMTEQSQFLGDRAWRGSEDTMSLPRATWQKALDLDYLESLLSERLQDSRYASQLRLFQDTDNNQLVISLPGALSFSGGSADLTPDGIAALEELAPLFSRLKNSIEVTGHADPEPIWNKEEILSNWDLSLQRAISVAAMLKSMGYKRSIDITGQADAQYALLDNDIPEDQRKALSRRVDILINADTGQRLERLGIEFGQ